MSMLGTLLQIHPLSAFMIAQKQYIIVDNQSVKLKPVNISDMHFEVKPPNLMTVKFSCFTVCI